MESGRTLQSRLRSSEEVGGPRRGNLCTADQQQLGSRARDGLFHCNADYVLLTMLKINAEVSPVIPRDAGNQTFPPERSQLSEFGHASSSQPSSVTQTLYLFFVFRSLVS